jgi:hypothetical protein
MTRKIDFVHTLAYRNCNPLNIRFSKDTNWMGSKLKSSKGFVVFATFGFGYRAAVMILRSYAKRGLKTVPQIIETWAPRSENNTVAYIKAVLDNLSERQSEPYTVNENTEIDLRNRELVVQLLLSMTRVEMGANAAQVHSMRTYAELGYDLAVSSPKFFGESKK